MAGRIVPVQGASASQLTDTYGANRSGGRSHKGIDIFADLGTPAVAAASGTVIRAGDSGGFGGLRVWVRDDEGLFHYYAHLNAVGVNEGQRIEAGQQLGTVGQTGNAAGTPAHLHYSVNPSQATSEQGALNPYEYLTSAGTVGGTSQVATPNAPVAALQERPEVGQRRSRDVMANIMASISRAASAGGGQVLDTRALFGDIFAGPPDSTIADETGAV